MSRPTSHPAELVPLAERLQHLQWLRIVLVAMTAAAAWFAGDALAAAPHVLAGAAGGFLVLTGWLQRVARKAGAAAPQVLGAALMLDGLALAAAAYATGGAGSPVRLLVVLHVIAVALLASYRTAMKVTVWHSLLVLVVFYAQAGGLLREQAAAGIGTPMQQLGAYVVVLWLVAVVTSTASAVNERELRRRRYDLEALAAMARRLDEADGAQGMAEVLVDAAVDLCDAPRALVLAAPAGRALLDPLAYHGDVRAMPADLADSPDVAAAMRDGATRLVARPDAVLAERLPGATRLVVVPLQPGGESVGVLVVEHGSRANRVERRVVAMLERCAAHAALALRGAWLLEEVHHLAATDALTGIANRGTFSRRLAEELSRCARADEPLSLLLIDVDHFKRLNDEHGHQVGDEVLKGVAALLRDGCREYDVAARYGGEEFAIVLPGADAEEALRIATRFRIAIASAALGPPVTVSVGVAGVPRHALEADGLVRAADDALYASKRGGRDRVTLAELAA